MTIQKMTMSEAGKLGQLKSFITQQKQKQERIDAYNQNPTMCKACQHPLEYTRRKDKFCDRSCSAKYNNLGRHVGKKHDIVIAKNTNVIKLCRICLICGKPLKKSKNWCSTKCHRKHLDLQIFSTIENTGISPSDKTAKRYLKFKHGHKCQICGIAEWCNQPVPLVLDHIDGNSYSKDINNLRIICPNCDAQTPTYKSKNKGKGRYYRRLRYKEGKSY